MKKLLDCIAIGASVLDTFVELESARHHKSSEPPFSKEQCFALGAKTEAKHIVQQSGGGATNIATTFARQKLACAIISNIGDDVAGKIVLHDLEAEGLDVRFINKITGGSTAQSVVLIDPDSERTILTDRGAATHIKQSDLDALNALQSRWVYITSLNGSIEAIDTVFAWAEGKDCKIAWNPGAIDLKNHSRHVKHVIEKTSLLIVNREEAAIIVGGNGSVKELAVAIFQLGATRAIISNGSDALACIDAHKIWTLTPSHVKAVDRTGAGDALGSGAVASLCHGSTFAEAVKFGLVNAEHVVMKVGAKSGILYTSK